MNFETLEYQEIAAKLKRQGWAIIYIWSGERDAFKDWLSESQRLRQPTSTEATRSGLLITNGSLRSPRRTAMKPGITLALS